MNSIFAVEGADDEEHSVSPVARYATCALADVPYVATYSSLTSIHGHPELRKFRAFLDEVVRVMDDCGVKPWTAIDDTKTDEVPS
jgi:hypothetical protein